MATSLVTVAPADGWVKVADTADAVFLVEQDGGAGSRVRALFRLDTAAPAVDAVGHLLTGRDAMPRMGVGHAYVKAVDVPVTLVVTV